VRNAVRQVHESVVVAVARCRPVNVLEDPVDDAVFQVLWAQLQVEVRRRVAVLARVVELNCLVDAHRVERERLEELELVGQVHAAVAKDTFMLTEPSERPDDVPNFSSWEAGGWVSP